MLISMDGFRWDYCALHPAETPHLRALAATGVSVHSMIPVYPSNTFPNHYSIATGLYPAHTGIVNNDFFDPVLGEYYYSSRPAYNNDPKWWGGEPIWVTAQKQGLRTLASYWVGSEAPIEGIWPTYYHVYDYYKHTFASRLEEIDRLMKLPIGERPSLICFYLEETNTAGHRYGPDSPELVAAVKLLDERIGLLQDQFKAEGIPVNFVIVSDHGMAQYANDSTIILDDYIGLKDVQIDFDGTEVGLRPLKGTAAELVAKLSNLPHAKAYLTTDLPGRLHLSGNPRIPPVWIMVDPGYEMRPRGFLKAVHDYVLVANHGYDNKYEQMHATLIANGPAFKSDGTVFPDAPNVDVYNLLCATLHLKPAKNDGDDTLVREFLR